MRKAKPTVIGSWLRQTHRWVSIAFTAAVVANFIVRVKGTPPPWVTYSPLLPLALLLLTGLYLFIQPYAQKWRGGGGTRGNDTPARGLPAAIAQTDPRSKNRYE